MDSGQGVGIKEIVVISGKGGTGKTSITAAFASFASRHAVFADCDVDAADLHLIFKPVVRRKETFKSGHNAVINPKKCIGCGKCAQLCRFSAVTTGKIQDGFNTAAYEVDPVACEGCGVCVRFCPADAIDFPERVCGEWFFSDTRFGTLVHARLGVGAENSGKLVTLLRCEAKKAALQQKADYLLIDGSPGIGCPVIASLTAADLALIVTEPTVSGDHDLRRIVHLVKKLGVPGVVCVNKWDINPQIAEAIMAFTTSNKLGFAGMIRYDGKVTKAQKVGQSVPEYCSDELTGDFRNIWERVKETVGKMNDNRRRQY